MSQHRDTMTESYEDRFEMILADRNDGKVALTSKVLGEDESAPTFDEAIEVGEGISFQRQRPPELKIEVLATVGLSEDYATNSELVMINWDLATTLVLLESVLKSGKDISKESSIPVGDTDVAIVSVPLDIISEMFPQIAMYWKSQQMPMPPYCQIIVPDSKGRLPWSEDGCDEFCIVGQPILGHLSEKDQAQRQQNELVALKHREEMAKKSATENKDAAGKLLEMPAASPGSVGPTDGSHPNEPS